MLGTRTKRKITLSFFFLYSKISTRATTANNITIRYSEYILYFVSPYSSINMGGKKSGRYVTTLSKKTLIAIGMIKNISFFVWDFFFVGIMAAIKNPIAETNLPKIQKVVALLALTFSTKNPAFL